MMKKALVILGPTATGKTDLGLMLAKKFNGELISADSRQVYKGLDIGTGKLPGDEVDVKKGQGFWEMDEVKVWMYDVVDPQVRYTVKDYAEQAEKIIGDILERGKLPIIVGGTGLYIRALLEGLPNLEVPVDEKLRGELEDLSLLELQEKLISLSPTRFNELNESDRKNPRRLLRSIELVHMYPYKRPIKNLKFKIENYDLLKVGLTAPRDLVKKRIFNRLISRIQQGMIKEAEELHQEGLSFQRMKELGLEYGMLAKLLEGEINQDQFVEQLSVKIYRYAKRQMTWFKKVQDILWFDTTLKDVANQVEKAVSAWYDSSDDQTD